MNAFGINYNSACSSMSSQFASRISLSPLTFFCVHFLFFFNEDLLCAEIATVCSNAWKYIYINACLWNKK